MTNKLATIKDLVPGEKFDFFNNFGDQVFKNKTINIDEDQQKTIVLQTTDIDNDTISYRITKLPSNGSISINNNIVIYTYSLSSLSSL